jgi:hypothetical protein
MTVNDVGKPCEVAPHARFERGPLATRRAMVRRINAPVGKPTGLSTDHLPPADQPAAYLTPETP